MIDFVIVCEKVFPFVSKLLIDENKIYSLANYSAKSKTMYSDHNSLITEMNINMNIIKPQRRVIYNYKNVEGFKKFKFDTSKKGKFSNIFNNNLSFGKQIKLWHKKFKFTLKNCFSKVRLKTNKVKKCKKFTKRKKAIMNKKSILRQQAEEELQQESIE